MRAMCAMCAILTPAASHSVSFVLCRTGGRRKHATRWWTWALLGTLLAAHVQADETGTITGRVDKPNLVTGITAVNRATDKKFPGKFDPKSGGFTIAGLPLDARYDCLIDQKAARLEGVNLKVPRSDYEEE